MLWKVIRGEDGPNQLSTLIPPYLHATRAARDVYDFEMADEDHLRLLNLVNQVQGTLLCSVVISRTSTNYELSCRRSGSGVSSICKRCGGWRVQAAYDRGRVA